MLGRLLTAIDDWNWDRLNASAFNFRRRTLRECWRKARYR